MAEDSSQLGKNHIQSLLLWQQILLLDMLGFPHDARSLKKEKLNNFKHKRKLKISNFLDISVI